MTAVTPLNGTQYTAKNATMQLLLGMAYKVQPSQIVDAPGWVSEREYDVSGRADGDTALTYDQLRPMLQSLLAQRFHLKVHLETKQLAGYALVVGRNGPKLTPAPLATGGNYITFNSIRCPGILMSGLAVMLGRPAGAPVVDQTGIAGTYAIKLNYAAANDTDSPLPSLYTAVEEQLGLKLEPRKVPVEMLVIDHIEEEPSEN